MHCKNKQKNPQTNKQKIGSAEFVVYFCLKKKKS